MILEFIKSQFTSSNFLFFVLIILFYLKYKETIELTKIVLIFWIILFLIASTYYIPKKLISKLENKYHVLNPENLNSNETYYILVLGSGYIMDSKLPATSQLGLTAIARLTEAIRIFNKLSNSVLITSGYSPNNLESQASIARRAAIELGVNPNRIQMLKTPSSTWEELKSFKQQFGKKSKLIIVTDAIHIPRAMKMAQKLGLTPIPSPTNFNIKEGSIYDCFNFLPSLMSIKLMYTYIYEFLATIKMELN